MPARFRTILVAATLVASGAITSHAAAQELAGAPQSPTYSRQPRAEEGGPGMSGPRGWREMSGHHRPMEGFDGDRGGRAEILPAPPAHAPPGVCYARVRVGPEYGPPPGGPEEVWTQQPGPPGSPGPIWCLTVRPSRPMMLSPERFGWVRVLCADDMTPGRAHRMKEHLRAHGFYHGPMDDRWDSEAGAAVKRFQQDRRIEHHGFLSIETIEAIERLPPRPIPCPERCRPQHAGPGPTTFETGYIVWPGKVRF